MSEYSIMQLSKIAGVSSRTLRYYDEIGLLEPLRINSAGYRIYGPAQVDRLQHILFFRALGVELRQIQTILTAQNADRLALLEQHLSALSQKRAELDRLINTVSQTIRHEKGEITMTDREKFAGFKKNLIKENENAYGREIREKYGDEEIDRSNEQLMNMTREEYDAVQALSADISASLECAVRTGLSAASTEGQAIAEKHRDWISRCWGFYSTQAHAGLVQMYLDDPRFTAYYDKNVTGCARFLCDAVALLLG